MRKCSVRGGTTLFTDGEQMAGKVEFTNIDLSFWKEHGGGNTIEDTVT